MKKFWWIENVDVNCTMPSVKTLPAILMIRYILILTILISHSIVVCGQDSYHCRYENDSMILECGCKFYVECYPGVESKEGWDSLEVNTIKCNCETIIKFLQEYPEVKIEIGLNTDYSMDSTSCKKSSDRRANIYNRELNKMGVDPTRYRVISYGNSLPLIVDSTILERHNYPFLKIGVKLDKEFILNLKTLEEKEAAYQLNRRTEIKIVEIKTSGNSVYPSQR